MNRKDTKLQEENIAVRDKGLVIVHELDRVVRTFNKVLKNKDERAKSIEADLQVLGKTLKENLDGQYEIDRNFSLYDNNIEKIIINLQHLEDEEETQAGRYEDLLNRIGIQEPDGSIADDATLDEKENPDLETLEKLRKRRENFLQSLNQEFMKLEEKLSSIGKLKKELEESRNGIGVKKVHTLGKKKALEEEGKKLLNEVGRLESELEATVFEEKNLIEESAKMIKHIETSLELDEKIDHVLFSSQTLGGSAKASSSNGHKIAIGS